RRPPRPTLFPYTTLFRSLWSRAIRQGRDDFGPPPVTARAAVSASSGGSAITASCLQVTQRRDGCSRSAVHTFRPQWPHAARCRRSEEHTSELQSRGHLVC